MDRWRSFQRVGAIEIVHVDLSADKFEESPFWDWLDQPERDRLQLYKNLAAKRQFALCRAALRSLLCDRLNCRNRELAFCQDQHGKPFATLAKEKAPVSFNVGHSGRHGLIALAGEGSLGVDLEEYTPRHDLEDLQSVLALGEREELSKFQGRERLRLFYRIWSAKEALIKAVGTGLCSFNLTGLEIPRALYRERGEGIFRLPDQLAKKWRLINLGTDEFAATLAYQCPSEAS